MTTIKTIVGVVLIIASFVFLLRNPSRSMIDNMRDNSAKKLKEALKAEREDKPAEAAALSEEGTCSEEPECQSQTCLEPEQR